MYLSGVLEAKWDDLNYYREMFFVLYGGSLAMSSLDSEVVQDASKQWWSCSHLFFQGSSGGTVYL